MIDIFIVYNDSSVERRIKEANINSLPFIHFIDERTLKGKKEAFKLKSFWGAKITPFAIILEDDKAIKAFYSETDNDIIESLIEYLNE